MSPKSCAHVSILFSFLLGLSVCLSLSSSLLLPFPLFAAMHCLTVDLFSPMLALSLSFPLLSISLLSLLSLVSTLLLPKTMFTFFCARLYFSVFPRPWSLSSVRGSTQTRADLCCCALCRAWAHTLLSLCYMLLHMLSRNYNVRTKPNTPFPQTLFPHTHRSLSVSHSLFLPLPHSPRFPLTLFTFIPLSLFPFPHTLCKMRDGESGTGISFSFLSFCLSFFSYFVCVSSSNNLCYILACKVLNI